RIANARRVAAVEAAAVAARAAQLEALYDIERAAQAAAAAAQAAAPTSAPPSVEPPAEGEPGPLRELQAVGAPRPPAPAPTFGAVAALTAGLQPARRPAGVVAEWRRLIDTFVVELPRRQRDLQSCAD